MDQIDYVFSEGQLIRRINTTTDGGTTWNQMSEDVLIPDAQSVQFAYFAAGNASTTDVDAITSVQITVALNVGANSTDFVGNRVRPQAMTARVTLRNRL
jgi:hypothetical protein